MSGNSIENKDEGQTVGERGIWSSKRHFLLAGVGLSVGLGNLWRFPYLCHKNGGGAFLIPYLLAVVVLGLPMYYLELAIGQFFSSGVLGVWKIAPIFKGVGYASVVLSCWVNVYYIIVLSWALFYLIVTSTGILEWSTCNNEWNTEACIDKSFRVEDLCTIKEVDGSQVTVCDLGDNVTLAHESLSDHATEFWENRMLNLSPGLTHVGDLQYELVGTLLILWFVCYFSIWKGARWTGKVLHFTVLFPYVLLSLFLVRGLTLPGSFHGIVTYLHPDFSKLLSPHAWSDAVVQVMFSFGLGLGTVVALGSYNKFKSSTPLWRDAALICGITSLTSIVSGFAIFALSGYAAERHGKNIEDFVRSGPSLAFVTLPKIFADDDVLGSFWAGLFYFLLLLLGLDSQFLTLEGFITAVLDEWPHVWRRKREILVGLVSIASFIIGLSCVTEGGLHVFIFMDSYAASGVVLWCVIFSECVAYSWGVGMDGLGSIIHDMTENYPNIWWKFCWSVAIPVACACMLFVEFITVIATQSDMPYPLGAKCFGWFTSLTSLAWIPGYAIWLWRKSPVGSDFRSKLHLLTRPQIGIDELRGERGNYEELLVMN